MSSNNKVAEPRFEILPGMIDSHFHTNVMHKKGLDADTLLSRALAAGMSGGIDIGIESGDTAGRLWLHEKYPEIKLAAGLYPSEAERANLDDSLRMLTEDLKKFPIAAVGEIGVDRYWNYGTVDRQQQLVQRQIELANRHQLPVIIHNREADREVSEVLRTTPPKGGGIMHCFSSDSAAARDFLEAGLYISFAGNLTYKKSEELRKAAHTVPLDRLLAETDSPFLSPQKVRGRLNHPGHVGFVYYQLAEIHNIEVEQLIKAIAQNFSRLFNR